MIIVDTRNDKRPKFSIVTVVYNAEDTIEKTVQSVISQTYINYEYIIIDGASNDKTLSLLRQLNISNILVTSESDEGIYDAMNKAVDYASGEYIYYINAGDYFCNENVLKEISLLIDKNKFPDILYGDVIGYGVEVHEKYLQQPTKLTNEYFISKTICHQAIFAKTLLFIKYQKFNTRFKIVADYVWLANMFIRYRVNFIYESIPICYFCLDGLSKTKFYPIEKYIAARCNFGIVVLLKNRYLKTVRKRINKFIKFTNTI